MFWEFDFWIQHTFLHKNTPSNLLASTTWLNLLRALGLIWSSYPHVGLWFGELYLWERFLWEPFRRWNMPSTCLLVYVWHIPGGYFDGMVLLQRHTQPEAVHSDNNSLFWWLLNILLVLVEWYAYLIRKSLAFRFGKGSACNEAQHNHPL